MNLPLELVELIVSFSLDDTEGSDDQTAQLSSYSLISRTWLVASRRHMFFKDTFSLPFLSHARRFNTFKTLFESPFSTFHLATITTLEMRKHASLDFLEWALQEPRISITDKEKVKVVSPPAAILFPNLTELHLFTFPRGGIYRIEEELTRRALTSISTLLRSYSSQLKRVSLTFRLPDRNPWFLDSRKKEKDIQVKPKLTPQQIGAAFVAPSLQHLELEVEHALIIPLLSKPYPELRSLRIHGLPDDLGALDRTLKAFTPCLERLVFDVYREKAQRYQEEMPWCEDRGCLYPNLPCDSDSDSDESFVCCLFD